MNAVPDTDAKPPASAAAEDADLRARRLETAARYLFTNLLPVPLVVLGLVTLLSLSQSLVALSFWATATIAMWGVTLMTLRRFLHDADKDKHTARWTLAICVAIFVSSLALGGVSPLFWVEGDRINNMLLYVLLAGAIAGAGAQSAPCFPLVLTNIAPYSALFLYLPLRHETFPMNLGLAFLQVCYIGLIALTARAVWQLADEMLRLRNERRDLIDRLRRSLVDTTAAHWKAEAASRAKSEFLANMSHELRTPLNAVLGFAEIIKDKTFGDAALDRYAQYGEHIHFSGKHLLGLISDILDLSKIEAGKRELDEGPVDLLALAGDAVRFMEPQAESKELKLSLDAAAPIGVRADERALRQVMLNLLSNAVKFTKNGGSVTMRLARTADGGVAIAVSDTGVGIKPEDMGHVLERFGQARQNVATAGEPGTGLGLPIVRGLVELHGGSFRLDSEPGHGTTVTVFLPANRVLEPRAATHAA